MIQTLMTIAMVFALGLSCSNEAEFGSGPDSQTTSADPSPVKAENAGQEKVTPPQSIGAEKCDEDKITVKWSKPEIQKCMDSGKIWHFRNKYDDKEYCSDVSAAKSYTCDRKGYQEYSEQKSGSTDILVQKLEEGSKLVSCGESTEGQGDWAMAQFITPKNKTNCQVSALPTTACFVNGSTGCESGDYDCIVQWCFDKAKL